MCIEKPILYINFKIAIEILFNNACQITNKNPEIQDNKKTTNQENHPDFVNCKNQINISSKTQKVLYHRNEFIFPDW